MKTHTVRLALNSKRRQAGLTLIELMIAMSLGLLVVGAATALLVSSKAGYVQEDEHAIIDDSGRFAIETISRAVRQVAYLNWDSTQAPVVVSPALSPNILGLDANSLPTSTAGISAPLGSSVNGSDVLALRFFGAGVGNHGDQTMLNCAGFGVPAVNSAALAEEGRGWSIFYVRNSASGEPELYCKYLGDSSWQSTSIVRGVESFQVLYGVDIDDDGSPNQFMNATALNTMDRAAGMEAGSAAGNAGTYWKKVVVVKVALLLRGSSQTAASSEAAYDLFGKDYSETYAGEDAGTHLASSDFTAAVRNRLRRIYSSTIQIRNRSSGSGA